MSHDVRLRAKFRGRAIVMHVSSDMRYNMRMIGMHTEANGAMKNITSL